MLMDDSTRQKTTFTSFCSWLHLKPGGCDVQLRKILMPFPTYWNTTPSHRHFEDSVVKLLCLYPSLWKEWFLNLHFSWWNQMHQGCLSLAKLSVAFSCPCYTDQTLLLLIISFLRDVHTGLDNHSKICSKPKIKA